MQPSEASRARELQEALDVLKREFCSKLRLAKSKGPSAPFPVRATLCVQAPPELDAYDVSEFKVALTIPSESCSPVEDVGIEVLSREVPLPIRHRMVELLSVQKRTARADGSWQILQQIFRHAQANFQALITSMPELVEAYECVDANGASMRRFMLSDPSSRLVASSSLLPSAAKQNAGGTEDAQPQRGEALDGGPPQGMASHKSSNDLIAKELAYLRQRYPTGFDLLTADEDSRDGVVEFMLELQPTDPAWDKSSALHLRGTFSAHYPQPDSASLQVACSDIVRPPLKAILDRILASQLAQESRSSCSKLVMRERIRDLENNACRFLDLAEDVLAETQQRQMETGPPSNTTLATGDLASLSLSDPPESDTAGASDSSAEEEGTDSSAPQQRSSVEANLEGHVSLLLLEQLQLDNIAALQPLALAVQVACSRCSSAWEVELASAAAAGSSNAQGSCGKCGREWSVVMRPRFVHAHSNIAAELRCEACCAIDLHPSLFSAQCESCASVLALRSVQVGKPSSRHCSSCHVEAMVQYASIAFAARGAARRQAEAGATTCSVSFKGPHLRHSEALPVGQELPALGTCKHYPHSHRWLRFPCCGRRFACDLCHEEGTDGHEMQWAMRHVCGFCSTEQKIGDRCNACNKRLTFNASGAVGLGTRHWEGGQGCRDKRRLDRRDRAKYRGSKHKTVSRKAFRVGQEGSARRKTHN